jgi:hypothetical protein
VDWGIGWQSDIFPHTRSTSVHPVMDSQQLESFGHSNSQLQESWSCWGATSLGAVR